MKRRVGEASILLLLSCALAAAAPQRLEEDPLELGSALLLATRAAIDHETEAYRDRLRTARSGTGPKENVDRFLKRLEELDAERIELDAMRAEDYPLPASDEPESPSALDASTPYGPVLPPLVRMVSITVDAPLAEGALLSVERTSRSGPFYHLAGIRGGDYGVLRPGKRYTLAIYLVYRREYFGSIGDYWVYVAEVR